MFCWDVFFLLGECICRRDVSAVIFNNTTFHVSSNEPSYCARVSSAVKNMLLAKGSPHSEKVAYDEDFY
jgi:hypothetical protein